MCPKRTVSICSPAAQRSVGTAAEQPHTPALPAGQRTLSAYLPNTTAMSTAVKEISLFFINSETPFQRIEHPNLVAAFSALGVPLPSRKQLAGKHMERIYEETKANVDATLKKVSSWWTPWEGRTTCSLASSLAA